MEARDDSGTSSYALVFWASLAVATAGCGAPASFGFGSSGIAQARSGGPAAKLIYSELNYRKPSGKMFTTFLTGIRGTEIVGMYVTKNGNDRGFIITAGRFSHVYYPGSADTVPYGPAFAEAIRVVGSYKLPGQKTNHGFFYDAAQRPKYQYFALDYPGATNTIPHSTLRRLVVGNWNRLGVGNSDFEKYPASGHGFVYDLTSKKFASFDAPGASSTTCFAIAGNAIAGGYTKPKGVHVVHGYIYDMSHASWHTYDHPGAIITHFDGISGTGKPGNYDLTGDWVSLGGEPHAFFLAVRGWKPVRWLAIDYPNATLTSGNSVFTSRGLTKVIGIYVDAGNVNGYVAYLD